MRYRTVVYSKIAFSFLCAFCLTIIPYGAELRWFRPDFVTLVLIYWVVYCPSYIGVTTGFFTGLLFDLMAGTLFGTMALIFSIVSYLCVNLRLRLRLYSYWQQCVTIVLIIVGAQLLRYWIQMILGSSNSSTLYLSTSISTAIFWPFVYLILTYYQRSIKA